MTDPVDLKRLGAVAILWLNRPDKRNAMNRAMLDSLSALLRDLAAEDAIRVIVIAGRGDSFCAGFDVSQSAGQSEYAVPDPIADYADLEQRFGRFLEIWDHPKPILAAVHGHCLAAATILCTMADVTIVADDAIIGCSMLPLGGGYIEPTWVHLVGPKRAKQLAFAPGGTISGAIAAQWGWANYSVPAATLHEDVFALAKRMSRMPSDILRLRKLSINRMVELGGFKEGVRLGSQTDALLHQSDAVKRVRRVMAELGVGETVRRFNAGDLEF